MESYQSHYNVNRNFLKWWRMPTSDLFIWPKSNEKDLKKRLIKYYITMEIKILQSLFFMLSKLRYKLSRYQKMDLECEICVCEFTSSFKPSFMKVLSIVSIRLEYKLELQRFFRRISTKFTSFTIPCNIGSYAHLSPTSILKRILTNWLRMKNSSIYSKFN